MQGSPNAIMLHLDTTPFTTDVNILLYGDTNLSSANNETIFKAVHKFISASKRFQTEIYHTSYIHSVILLTWHIIFSLNAFFQTHC